ncbi:MAG: hypothetical protein HQL83_12675 [Magnetococcales bacterium]|nr:hypothetical protein [Magnetococcales bacterium]
MVHDAIDAPIVLLDISNFDRLPTISAKRNILERLQQLITQCAKPFVGFCCPMEGHSTPWHRRWLLFHHGCLSLPRCPSFRP